MSQRIEIATLIAGLLILVGIVGCADAPERIGQQPASAAGGEHDHDGHDHDGHDRDGDADNHEENGHDHDKDSDHPKDDSGKGADAETHAADEVAKEAVAHAGFYTIAEYDLEADPAEQLKATLVRAQSENKTVLLQVGGDWCGWCKLMTQYIDKTDSVNHLLDDHYLIQKVTFDQKNKNEAFLSAYPEIPGYPHLFVLSKDGEMLHSQNTSDLEDGKGYSEEAFVKFLNQWKPETK